MIQKQSTNNHETIIVGAGAAGISLAYQLRLLNKDSLILEGGTSIAHSWNTMPDHLKVISHFNTNSIDFKKSNQLEKNHRMPAKEYARYLAKFAQTEKLKIRLDTKVEKIEQNAKDGEHAFVIHTNKGKFTAKKVIWAAGYYQAPQYPCYFEDSKKKILSLHFKDFKSAKDLSSRGVKKVLIIGKRLSAGQCLVECYEQGLEVALSSRSKVEFMLPPIINNIFNFYIEFFEKLILLLMSNKKKNFEVPMERDRAYSLINENKVKTFPDIIKIEEGGAVTFKNGKSEKFDCLIYATGFKENILPSINSPLDNLKNDFEHPQIGGLYFLGFNNQRNFRSRFLRGIREDARILAKLLAQS